MKPAPDRESIDFCLDLARALQANGTAAHRLEEILNRVAAGLGLEGAFFATTTALFTSLRREGEHSRTYLLRTSSGSIQLERLARLHELVEELLEGRLEVHEAALSLENIAHSPDRYGLGWVLLAFGSGSALFARLLGGGWREVLLAFLLGLLLGALASGAARWPRWANLMNPLGAAWVAFLAIHGARLLAPSSPSLVTLAGLIILLPGLTTLTAMNELANGHLMAGTSRLMGAGMTFLLLAFGVALGQQLGASVLARMGSVSPLPLPNWTLALALAAVPLSFSILFQARPRDFGWIALGCALAFGGSRLGAWILGPEFGVALGAGLVTMGANAAARKGMIPSAVIQLPGLLLLVPGSLGFRGLTDIFQKHLLTGLNTAFQMLFIALAMLTGMLLAHAALPARKD